MCNDPLFSKEKLSIQSGSRGRTQRNAIIEAMEGRLPIDLPLDRIAAFCERWKITEFALFGSVLREDFRPDSDVDVLVSFQPRAPWSLWDLVEMQEELGAIFGRPVDLIEKEGLRNPYRRHEILSTRRVVYAA